MGVQALIGGLVGLAFVGWGARVLVRGDAPTIKSTGRVWHSVFAAAAFWFLLGLACLVTPFVWIGHAAGWMGSDASFWVLQTSGLLALLAVTWFRPRKAPDLPRR
ncbi:hypothetical protein [Actinoplanes sp. NPDC049681]|uniref:hypothetical protein n=1 Tax=Actinoplanes sp. NPDC049681 TaxID=3363905 RepID=UPI0037BC8888